MNEENKKIMYLFTLLLFIFALKCNGGIHLNQNQNESPHLAEILEANDIQVDSGLSNETRLDDSYDEPGAIERESIDWPDDWPYIDE